MKKMKKELFSHFSTFNIKNKQKKNTFDSRFWFSNFKRKIRWPPSTRTCLKPTLVKNRFVFIQNITVIPDKIFMRREVVLV